MPTITAYDQAMSSSVRMVPAINRLGGGTIAMAGRQQPWRIEGEDAVVYRLDQAGRRHAALRCFLDDDPDPRALAVYQGLSAPATLRRLHAQENVPLVQWVSLEQDGVAVPGKDFRSILYPLVAMEWIGGPTLLDAVDRACRGRDVRVLQSIATAWLRSMTALAAVRFVHGDLTADNALIHLERGVVLVDYDHSWWPGLPAPMPRRQASTPYQHRQREPEAPERLDHFASLVIYTSLRILAAQPDLRAEYGDPNGMRGGALLFSARDLADPDRSQLFRQIREIDDPEARALTGILREACLAEPDLTPSLAEAEAAVRLVTQSMPKRDPVDPYATWGAHRPPEASQPPAARSATSQKGIRTDAPAPELGPAPKPYTGDPPTNDPAFASDRVSLRDQLAALQEALEEGDAGRVAELWPRVRNSPAASPFALEAHELVARFANAGVREAMEQDDPQPLVHAIKRAEALGVAVSSEARRASRTKLRRQRQKELVEGLVNAGDVQKLTAAAMSGQLNVVGRLGREGEAAMRIALQIVYLQRTIELDDDARILSAWTKALQATPHALDARTKARVDLAAQRTEWKKNVRQALRRRDTARLATIVREAPEGALDRLTESERRRIDRLLSQQKALAHLQQALLTGNDRSLVDAMNEVESVGATLPPDLDWDSIRDVVDRLSLVASIRHSALSSPPDYPRLGRLLPAARDAFGHQTPYLGTQLDFETLEREVQRVAHAQRLREAIATGNESIIAKAAVPDPHGALQTLPEHEQQLVRDILGRRGKLDPLRQ